MWYKRVVEHLTMHPRKRRVPEIKSLSRLDKESVLDRCQEILQAIYGDAPKIEPIPEFVVLSAGVSRVLRRIGALPEGVDRADNVKTELRLIRDLSPSFVLNLATHAR